MLDLGKREGNLPGLAVDLNQRERSSAKVDWPSKRRLPAAYSDRAIVTPWLVTTFRAAGQIEIALSNGRVVRVEESIDPATLARIVAALDGAAP